MGDPSDSPIIPFEVASSFGAFVAEAWDTRVFRKLGNAVTSSTSEVLASARPYTEQSSQAQRSIKSSSIQDKSGGTGAVTVRLTYLDNNYVVKTEDINLNGKTAVNTVNTDIRFIENLEVIAGAVPAGNLSFMSTTGGNGSEICGINLGDMQSFLCHHYVPAGKIARVLSWGAATEDQVNLRLVGQNTVNSNTVNIIIDKEFLDDGGVTPPFRVDFTRQFKAVRVPEKTCLRILVTPNQVLSTVIRAWMEIWEDSQ